MKKILAFAVAAITSVACLTGCGGGGSSAKSSSTTSTAAVSSTTSTSEASQSGSSEDNSEIRVAFLAQANNTFWAKLTENAVAKAKEMGITLDTFNAGNEVNEQIAQLESAMSNNYDAIIIGAVDSAGLKETCQQVMDAGIPLVTCNLKVDDEAYDVYVGSEDYDAGFIQGSWIAEATDGECNVGVLYVPIGCSAEIGRTAGLKASLFEKYDTAKIVAEDDGKAMIDEGMRITEDWLQSHSEITVIAAENDQMALGAMQACQSAGRDDILICGVDADQEAVQAIIDGSMAMTVFQNSKDQAQTAVEVAVGLAKGKTYDKEVIIPFEEVNKDNAEDYLNK